MGCSWVCMWVRGEVSDVGSDVLGEWAWRNLLRHTSHSQHVHGATWDWQRHPSHKHTQQQGHTKHNTHTHTISNANHSAMETWNTENRFVCKWKLSAAHLPEITHFTSESTLILNVEAVTAACVCSHNAAAAECLCGAAIQFIDFLTGESALCKYLHPLCREAFFHIHSPILRAATSHYFYYQGLCQLFSSLILLHKITAIILVQFENLKNTQISRECKKKTIKNTNT